MKYKICFAITSRADFSLAYPIINKFKKVKKFKISVVTSGYLSGKKYGKKIDLVKKKLNKIDLEIKNFPKKDTDFEITKSLSDGILKFSNFLNETKPDFLFVFADKFEMLVTVISSIQFKIPICHVEGGDITEGAIDDNIRHAITKLSHIHFVSTEKYKKRLIQLGEDKKKILVCGSPSLDLISKLKVYSKSEIVKKFNLDPNKKIVLCTFHPVTNEIKNTEKYIDNIINSFKKNKFNIIFTSPNADLSNQIIVKKIKKFSRENTYVKYLKKLNYLEYLSFMKNCDFMIGNSSSGIIESASLNAKVINIGSRQKGRLIPKNVISCGYDEKQIKSAINKIIKFKPKFFNPYYKKNSSKMILDFFISKMSQKDLVNKKFKDIK